MSPIADNLERVRDRIRKAAAACGRKPEDITLIAVSKNFPRESISEAIAAGQLHFGENRIQEAETKIPHFADHGGIVWHMIGHLQSNKAPKSVALFQVIHSVDSVKLAQKLDDAAAQAGRTVSILLQVDLGHEATKFGAGEEQILEIIDAILGCSRLRLDGLMTVPPFFEEVELTRPYFARLRSLRDEIERRRPGALGRKLLSMGMSHDFEIAIQEGANILRVGTAIFGEREY
jgi:pyridoxal phosphate enzyme (YggS family)